MVQRTQVIKFDDLDESEATETIRFGLDGGQYEIDLNDQHARELREALEPFRAAARRESRHYRRPATTTSGRRNPEIAKMRAWAAENGYQVSSRGRIPQYVQDAYDKAVGEK